MKQNSQHQCLIYEGSPLSQLPGLAAVTKKKMSENYRCLYLNSPSMTASMSAHLAAAGVDVTGAIAKGGLVLSSEPTVLDKGKFDIDFMLRKLEEAIDQALRDGYQGLFATGDMTWEFGPEENFSKLLEYEWRLEKLFHKRPTLSGICQYHHDTLPLEATRQGLLSHQVLFINETLSLINQYYSPSEMGAKHESKNPELDKKISLICKSQYAY